MEKKLKRVLFFAEATTLAHVARCVAIANALNQTGHYIVALAADNRYDKVVGELAFKRFSLFSVSSNYFFNKLSKGSPLYNVDILSRYVQGDIKVIEAFKPDFIIGDFRLSLAISSRLKKIPYATITNAYWSPYADISYPVPEIPLTKIVGITMAQKLFDWFRPLVFFVHSIAFNKTCKKFGLPPLVYDMRETYTHADYTLYADMESLVPMKSRPENHFFIGPVLWSANVVLPEWWSSLPKDKPVVFVSLGSSGDSSLLPIILEALNRMPVTVLCVTASKTLIEKNYSNVFMASFVPAEEVVKKSDIVICNGGSPMVYQALVEEKKIIGIPGNLDQYLMMSILKKSGKGQIIRSGKLNQAAIIRAVNNIIAVVDDSGLAVGGNLEYSKLDLDKIEEIIHNHHPVTDYT